MVYVPMVYFRSTLRIEDQSTVLLALALFASCLVSGTSGHSRYLSPDMTAAKKQGGVGWIGRLFGFFAFFVVLSDCCRA